MKRKRLLIVGDMHCGHSFGLTHPRWQVLPQNTAPQRKRQVAKYQKEVWEWLEGEVKKLRPIDYLAVMGDAIDGKGKKSRGVEISFPDLGDQVDMACDVIEWFRAKKVVMIRGTPYHVGKGTSSEDAIAKEVKAAIEDQIFLDIHGLILDLKHHVGRSAVPHGQHTAIARERMVDALEAERGRFPHSDVTVRAHVHYHRYAGGPGWLAMTCPALQGPSIYGNRIMSGDTDFGFLVFDIAKDGGYTWEARLANLEVQRKKTVKL